MECDAIQRRRVYALYCKSVLLRGAMVAPTLYVAMRIPGPVACGDGNKAAPVSRAGAMEEAAERDSCRNCRCVWSTAVVGLTSRQRRRNRSARGRKDHVRL